MKRLLIFLTAILVLTAAFASAQNGHRGQRGDGSAWHKGGHDGGMNQDGMPGAGRMLLMAEEIGLDENQKTKISGMMEEFGLNRIELKAELEKAQLELKHMRLNEASDAEILTQMDKVGELKTDMRKMSYTHHQAVKDVLTDQQIEKLKELHKERRGDREGRSGFGKREGRGQGHGYGRGPNDNANCWRQ